MAEDWEEWIDRMEDLTDEVRRSARRLRAQEARYLVDSYYEIQEQRKRTNNQVRALGDAGESPVLALWLAQQSATLEGNLHKLLQAYAEESPTGQWALSQVGIGPVIAAGLLAHIDITKAPTVGHIWRFAGQDPTLEWYGRDGAEKLVKAEVGEATRVSVAQLANLAERTNRTSENIRRTMAHLQKVADPQSVSMTADNVIKALALTPFNARLKVLCWKIGDSFVKQSGRAGCVYGQVYRERKAKRVERNERGEFAETARVTLATKRFKDNATRKRYQEGKLPDGRIDLQARRETVKLFLAHWHHVAYEVTYGTPPPKPYVIEHGGHTDFMGPPNWPMD